jgi:hypothetical protein
MAEQSYGDSKDWLLCLAAIAFMQTPSFHNNSWYNRHPEAARPSAKTQPSESKKRFGWRGACDWLWGKMFDTWAFTAAAVGVCLAVGFVLAQEHIFLGARALIIAAAILMLFKIWHEIRKDKLEPDVGRSVLTLSICAILAVSVILLWACHSMEQQYRNSLSRADIHVDEVTVEIEDNAKFLGLLGGLPGSTNPAGVVAHVSGHNQSPSTSTSPYPMVRASVSARPYITDPEEEEDELFTRGMWANESYVGLPYVLNPMQTFSFSKREAFTTLGIKGVSDTGHPFSDTWDALARGDVVLYVVTKANYGDKWGNVNEVRTCSVFSVKNNFSRGTCAGQFKIGLYQP